MKQDHRRWKVCFGTNYWGTQKGTDPMEVPQEELRAFMKKWGIAEDGECTRTLTRAEERQMEQENPLDGGFCAELVLNGMRLRPSDGCGVGYLPGDAAGNDEAAELLFHYGLEKTKIWRFWRNSYPWATKSRRSCLSIDGAGCPVGNAGAPG